MRSASITLVVALGERPVAASAGRPTRELVSSPMFHPNQGGDPLSSQSTQRNPARACDRRFGV